MTVAGGNLQDMRAGEANSTAWAQNPLSAMPRGVARIRDVPPECVPDAATSRQFCLEFVPATVVNDVGANCWGNLPVTALCIHSSGRVTGELPCDSSSRWGSYTPVYPCPILREML